MVRRADSGAVGEVVSDESLEDPSLQPFVVKKITVPRGGTATIDRPRLQLRLDVCRLKLAVVQAAAGFGKTTLMQQWRERLYGEGWSCAWLTLDDADNDVRRLSVYLDAALRSSRLFDDDSDIADRALASSKNALLANVLHALACADKRVALFLDDFDALTGKEAIGFIRTLISATPASLIVIVGCRRAPSLGQTQYRLRNELLEVGADDLRFKPAETQALVDIRLMGRIGEPGVSLLTQRTEGWATALQLACLAAAEHDDADAFLRSFDNVHDDLAEYLSQEVVADLGTLQREFLFETACLQDLTGALCDAITGRNDGQAMLAYFHERSLFIRRVGTIRGEAWYRYHGLFAEFLRRQWLALAPERVPRIHRVACDWYAAQGMLDEASVHARLGGQHQRSTELLDGVAMATMRRGQFNTIIAWVDRLVFDELQYYPRLTLAYLWALAFSDRPWRAVELLRELEGTIAGAASADAGLKQATSCLELVVAGRTGNMERICDQGPAILASYSAQGDRFHFGTSALVLAHGYISRGWHRRAHDILREAREAITAEGQLLGNVFFATLQGLVQASELRLHEALAHLRRGMELARHDGPTYSHATAIVAGFLGEVLYESNHLSQAQGILPGHLALIGESGLPDAILNAWVTMARIARHEGDVAGAWGYLLDAEALALRRSLARVVDAVRWEMVHLACTQGDFTEAQRVREQIPSDAQVRHGSVWFITCDIALARMALWMGRVDDLVMELESIRVRAQSAGFRRPVLTLTILRALALAAKGQMSLAIAEMVEALRIGLPGGAVRSFLDEGPQVMSLIEAAAAQLTVGLSVQEGSILRQRYEALIIAGEADREAGIRHSTIPAQRKSPTRPGPLDPLTEREMQVLECLERGLSNQQLAASLQISETTVKWHLRNIFSKLGVDNRTEAVFAARQFALI